MRPFSPTTHRRAQQRLVDSLCFMLWKSCNYQCKFCWHPDKGLDAPFSLSEAADAIHLLRDSGVGKVNFCGGEPFFKAKGTHVGKLLAECKREVPGSVHPAPVTGIMTNGSLVTREWFDEYGEHCDVLAISVDSFREETNRGIGRAQGRRPLVGTETLAQIRSWCDEFGVRFKLNTVVNRLNVDEDMGREVAALEPDRWKLFQVSPAYNENYGPGAPPGLDFASFQISRHQFDSFVRRHESYFAEGVVVPETSEDVDDGYLLLDPSFCFEMPSALPTTAARSSRSILEVGAEAALGR
mmetsp:Transcript_47226/g.131307  ORF Transcript_47226/g.131307 Transcript_47226/m.131307 type:complete len:297 (+) Transcript_47226:204-1094(+)